MKAYSNPIILVCFIFFRASASRYISSIVLAWCMYSWMLINLIAFSLPVSLWIAHTTEPNPPSPSLFLISYSSKITSNEKSSPISSSQAYHGVRRKPHLRPSNTWYLNRIIRGLLWYINASASYFWRTHWVSQQWALRVLRGWSL